MSAVYLSYLDKFKQAVQLGASSRPPELCGFLLPMFALEEEIKLELFDRRVAAFQPLQALAGVIELRDKRKVGSTSRDGARLFQNKAIKKTTNQLVFALYRTSSSPAIAVVCVAKTNRTAPGHWSFCVWKEDSLEMDQALICNRIFEVMRAIYESPMKLLHDVLVNTHKTSIYYPGRGPARILHPVDLPSAKIHNFMQAVYYLISTPLL
jgi:hypothetical protein